MEVFVARQPISNRNEGVFGYELLYRNSKVNKFTHVDADQATKEVLINSFVNIGLKHLSENKPCFVNFTEQLLLDGLPLDFPPEKLIVEILEDVNPTPEVIAACKELKSKGYRIALDDVVAADHDRVMEMVEYIDIIKMDIRQTSIEERKEIIRLAEKYNIQVLAEKVETREEHQQLLVEGVNFFQGFFYSKPHIVSSYDIPLYNFTYLQLLKELSMTSETINIDEVADIFKRDLSLTFKLLRLINSSTFNLKVDIHSIKQAIMLLGTDALKKWLYLLSMDDFAKMGTIGSKEILKISFQRAKMCELIAEKLRLPERVDGYFLTGLLSMVDVIMGRPLNGILEQLPLENQIKRALLAEENRHRKVLDLVISIERAEFGVMEEKIQAFELSASDIFNIYEQSIKWTDSLYKDFFTQVEENHAG
ncbi:EAL and HDOD domain-containing protein [Thalassobacillus hwangdonensis]|uniref:EAL and HDOD domain-containing protein n=1 Tax=Thalassobacillus hwangdonensis TaxID=546108 RepID=A0ABW3L3M0_9BACI